MGMVTSRGPEFKEGVDYNAMSSVIAMASLGFKVADYSLQPPQAIAILAAGDQVDDEFGIGTDKFERMSKEDIASIFNGKGVSVPQSDGKTFVDYNFGLNQVYINGNWVDAHMLMYKKSDADEYIVQVNGKLIHIKPGFETNDDGFMTGNNVCVYNTEDAVIDFAIKNGITEHTVLGAKIILKLLMANMDYDMRKLDEALMDPKADYLAFVNQTLSPIIEAGLTATMSGLKSAIEFLKKIVQKASS